MDHFQTVAFPQSRLPKTGARHEVAVTFHGHGPRIAPKAGNEIQHRDPLRYTVRLAEGDRLEVVHFVQGG